MSDGNAVTPATPKRSYAGLSEDEKYEVVLELINYGATGEHVAREVFGFRTWAALYKRMLKRPDIYERYQEIRASATGKRPKKAYEGQKWMALFELIGNGWYLKDASKRVFGKHWTTIHRMITKDPNKVYLYEKAKERHFTVRKREAHKRHIARNKEAHKRMMADPERHALELKKRRANWLRYTSDSRFVTHRNALDRARRQADVDNTPFSELKKKWIVPPGWRWMNVDYGKYDTTEEERRRDGREISFVNMYVVDEEIERRSRKYNRTCGDTD